MDIGSDAPPLTPAGRRIVDAAEELFYERGITAAGVDLIAEHSGVTKRTLYNRFGSKDNLVAAYLAERDRRWRSAVRAAVDASDGAEEAVTAPFEALRSWTTTYTRGCAFLNALAELPDPRHPGHRVAAEQKRWLLGLFEELAAAAGCHGPATLATRLFVLHEGAVATAPLSLGTVAAAGDLARELVRAAVRG
ncbi:TetR/AcrR family transcriptional regulator [Streptomyces pseudogriseolus]|uniref:TetR family transcriptional regulator n=3 Tax=Streptomyces TaxID=1883 RepID=M3BZZ9_STREZ|nr:MULTISPECIES: TetR/AcrR family transcriptional regulator [Streptomyces]EMF29614.1 TetR family transcriptional regulator [Streptomyces gancidicus BKS 13-15]MCI4145425.1 TetR/AcrR family transcriptional regulator [Streptomyces sp. MMS20-AI2-20]GGS63103.1 TetR family transcriptional regulator [Streptomyces rubiginosus]